MVMTQKQAKQLLRSEMDKWDLYLWTISFNKRKRGMGVTNMRKKNIELSIYLLKYGSDEQILDTMRHEIAHALDFEERGTSDHSWRWKSTAMRVGANPERTTEAEELNMIPTKYTITCDSCGQISGISRRPKNMDRKYCAICWRRRGVRSKLSLTQNW